MGATATQKQKTTPFGERYLASQGKLSADEQRERYRTLGEGVLTSRQGGLDQVLRTVIDSERASKLAALLATVAQARTTFEGVEACSARETYAAHAARLLRAAHGDAPNVVNVANEDVVTRWLKAGVDLKDLIGYVHEYVEKVARLSSEPSMAGAKRLSGRAQKPQRLGNKNTGSAYRRAASWLAVRAMLMWEGYLLGLIGGSMDAQAERWIKVDPQRREQQRLHHGDRLEEKLFDWLLESFKAPGTSHHKALVNVVLHLENAGALLLAYPPAELCSLLPKDEAIQPPPMLPTSKGRDKLVEIEKAHGKGWFDQFWAVAKRSRYAPAVAVVAATGARPRELHEGILLRQVEVTVNGEPLPAILVTIHGAKTNIVEDYGQADVVARRRDKGLGDRTWPFGIDAEDTAYLWTLFDTNQEVLDAFAVEVQRQGDGALLVRWKGEKDHATATKLLNNAFNSLHKRAFGTREPMLTPTTLRHAFSAVEEHRMVWDDEELARMMGHVSPETRKMSYGRKRQAKTVRSKRPTIYAAPVTTRAPRPAKDLLPKLERLKAAQIAPT